MMFPLLRDGTAQGKQSIGSQELPNSSPSFALGSLLSLGHVSSPLYFNGSNCQKGIIMFPCITEEYFCTMHTAF